MTSALHVAACRADRVRHAGDQSQVAPRGGTIQLLEVDSGANGDGGALVRMALGRAGGHEAMREADALELVSRDLQGIGRG